MRSLSEIRESPNYDRLRNSVEAKACTKDCVIVGILFAVFTLIMALPTNNAATQVLSWLAYLFLIFPFFLYAVYKLVEIFLHIDSYAFTEVVFDHPRLGYRGSMSFAVTLDDRQGRKLELETGPIFSHGSPNFEEYVNQKVLVGYNDKTERVVVIKKIS